MKKPKPVILDYPERPKPPEPLPPEQQAAVDDFFEWLEQSLDQPQEPRPMREDGEPLTGIEEIDYPPDIAHPGNDGILNEE